MKYIDFTVQTLFMALGVGVLIAFRNESLRAILGVQLFLGPWQFVSSLVTVLARAPYWKAKQKSLIAACIYLALVFIGLTSESLFTKAFIARFWIFFLTIPAWSLAVYYYIITCKWALLKKGKQSRFLPHISF